MNVWKFTTHFSLLIVFLFAFIAISCKESSIPTESTNKILNAETIEKLQAAADKVMMENQTPGMMAYISVDGEGEGIYITRGVSNLTTSEPMNINNSFRIGSITKTFTTEAVLILVDEGKIDLNKPISFYLPELNIPSGDKITIPMLANMSSGLFDYSSDMNLWTPYINSNEEKVFTPEELLVLSFSHPLLFEPGTEYNYCNANTVLLGLLIKKVTGKEVRDVFSEKILQPLGMKNTFWPITNYLPYPYNHGYTSLLTGSLIESTNWNTSWADAAGILISNISDMKIWTKELYDRKLLSDKMKSERFAWIDDIPGIKYSGFGVEKVFDWIGKSGSIFGYNSEAWYNPVKKITIIINTNSNDGLPADNVFASFIDILTPYK